MRNLSAALVLALAPACIGSGAAGEPGSLFHQLRVARSQTANAIALATRESPGALDVLQRIDRALALAQAATGPESAVDLETAHRLVHEALTLAPGGQLEWLLIALDGLLELLAPVETCGSAGCPLPERKLG